MIANSILHRHSASFKCCQRLYIAFFWIKSVILRTFQDFHIQMLDMQTIWKPADFDIQTMTVACTQPLPSKVASIQPSARCQVVLPWNFVEISILRVTFYTYFTTENKTNVVYDWRSFQRRARRHSSDHVHAMTVQWRLQWQKFRCRLSHNQQEHLQPLTLTMFDMIMKITVYTHKPKQYMKRNFFVCFIINTFIKFKNADT